MESSDCNICPIQVEAEGLHCIAQDMESKAVTDNGPTALYIMMQHLA